MRTLLFFIIYATMFFSATFCFAEQTTWNFEDENFSAIISVEPSAVQTDEWITLSMKLKYPSSYRTNINQLKDRLLNSNTLQPPAFILENEHVISKEKENVIEESVEWILSPKQKGKHFLVLQELVFQEIGTHKEKRLFPDIFKIEVSQKNDHFVPKEYIAPLLKLSTRIPIEINRENAWQFQSNSEVITHEKLRNEQVLINKSFPWKLIIALLTLGIGYFLLKITPLTYTPRRKEAKLKPAEEALKELDQLKTAPATPEKLSHYFDQLDHAMRTYFVTFYGNEALTYTSQELQRKIQLSHQFNAEMKSTLTHFQKNIENVKYGRTQPTLQDFNNTIQMAQTLIQTQVN